MENDNIKVPTADELNEGSNTSTADASTPNDGNAVDETVEGEKKAPITAPNNENDIANDNTPKGESQGESSTPTGDTLTDGNNVTDEGSNTNKEEFVLTIDNDTWFSVSQAKKTFGFTRDLLRSRYRNNNIPYKQVDGKYFFRESDLQALKAELDAKTPRQITPLKVQVTDTSTTTAIVPAANIALADIATLTAEIKFYDRQMKISSCKYSFEIGARLIAAKKLVKHGEWKGWLENNFSYTQNFANRLMAIAERFSKYAASHNFDQLTTSHWIELLALPTGNEEEFLADNDVANMTSKQTRQAVADVKNAMQAEIDKINADNDALSKKLANAEIMLSNAENELKNLREKPVDVKAVEMPKDYSATKKANDALTKENTELKAKIDTLKGDSGLLKSNAITLMNQLINFAKALSDVDEEDFKAAVTHYGELTSVITDVARRIQALKDGE